VPILGAGKFGYAYVAGLNLRSSADAVIALDDPGIPLPPAAGAAIFAGAKGQPGSNHPGLGGNVLLVDGRVESWGTGAQGPLIAPGGGRFLAAHSH